MKGNKKILIAAILLLLIAVSYGTYAIYKESVSATGTIEAAAWSVKINNSNFSTASITLNLNDLTCSSNPGKNGTIAPGATCYKDLVIDADGSEVDVVVDASLDTTNSSNIPTNMTVTVEDSNHNTGPVTIPYSATEGAMEKTVRVNVVWPGAATDSASKNQQDVTDQNKTITLAVNVTASQALS